MADATGIGCVGPLGLGWLVFGGTWLEAVGIKLAEQFGDYGVGRWVWGFCLGFELTGRLGWFSLVFD